MQCYEVVSLDMFQTLVNVNSRIEQVWESILGQTFSLESANEHARLLLEYYHVHSNQLKDLGPFYLTAEVYTRSYESVFTQKGLTYDLQQAVQILFQEHTQSHFYEDTIDFLNRITKKYKTCLVSDADEAMIPDFYKEYGIHAFISERYRSYKNDKHNTMFKALLKRYDVDPSKVIHIGDSVSDILGAKREGIVACWINREKQAWQHEVKPDMVIESFNDLVGVL